MPAKRTSKSIVQRIDSDYYKKQHWLRRWRQIASWSLFVIPLAWCLAALAVGDHRMYQAAPLSEAHKFIGNDCRQCHTQAWEPVRRLLFLDSSITSTPDDACLKCHAVGDHSPLQVAADIGKCGSCHREHRPDKSLLAVRDSQCTDCHADLRVKEGAKVTVDPHVVTISAHPEFAIFRQKAISDPANIKFNHAVHLKADGILGPGGKKEKLECAACHQPDSEGRYITPVTYEAGCARCHQNALIFDSERFAVAPVPHGDVAAAAAMIRKNYTDYVRFHPEVLKEAPPELRFNPSRPHDSDATLRDVEWKWVEHEVSRSEQRLGGSGGCRYCHDIKRNPDASWSINNATMRARWYPMSVFRHDSHRMLRCISCHPAETSSKTSDILMPAIQNCKQCHDPAVAGSSVASSECVACHNYHSHSQQANFDGRFQLHEWLKSHPTNK